MTLKRIIITLSLVLLLSLAGNAFQAGLMIGKNAELAAMKPKVLKLPAADQKILQDAMAASKPKMDEWRQKVTQARAGIQKAMDADPFEKSELDASLKRFNDAKRDFLVYLQKQRTETVNKLSPEAREMLRNAAAPQQQQRSGYPPFVWEDMDLQK